MISLKQSVFVDPDVKLILMLTALSA